VEKYITLLQKFETLIEQPTGAPFQFTSLLKGGDRLILKAIVDQQFFLDNFKGYYGAEDCDTKERRMMQIPEYFNYLLHKDYHTNYYLKDIKISNKLFNTIFSRKQLNALVENWLNLLPSEVFPNLRWFYLGKKGNYSSFHYDVFNSAAWNILFEGVKAWFFIRTDHYLNRDELRRLTGLIMNGETDSKYELYGCLQKTGDIIYVDSDVPHMVVNVSNSLSFTENVVNSHNIDAVIKKTETYNKEWSGIFKNLRKYVAE
jgi:histone arginine demethylase JMJD6